MPDRIRFHLDENVHGAVAHGLRLHDVDVTTTGDAGLLGEPDSAQLAFAVSQKRVLVTHDSHFVEFARQGIATCGVAYFDRRRAQIGRMVRALTALWRSTTPEEMEGQLRFL